MFTVTLFLVQSSLHMAPTALTDATLPLECERLDQTRKPIKKAGLQPAFCLQATTHYLPAFLACCALACARSDAATDLTAAGVFGLRNSALAFVATEELVCLLFVFMIKGPLPKRALQKNRANQTQIMAR